MTGLQLVRRAYWRMTGLKGRGVHAVALTPSGEVVLVRLSYAPGWRLPGGGRGRREEEEAAMLRELREEIGLVAHGPVERAAGGPGRRGYFVVRDVRYRPSRNFEIEEVRAFAPGALPPDMPRGDRGVIEQALASA
jgi:8-oxo-dGTP pyrophosphatase MutT (NUDIX family)